uniref:EB domain-containing protein n=1 Tax=Timema shepardi TaxID=629360 RepID=A0A7R9G2K3_TIMSH|nr:unnamed protein product [Timema shepardi]
MAGIILLSVACASIFVAFNSAGISAQYADSSIINASVEDSVKSAERQRRRTTHPINMDIDGVETPFTKNMHAFWASSSNKHQLEHFYTQYPIECNDFNSLGGICTQSYHCRTNNTLCAQQVCACAVSYVPSFDNIECLPVRYRFNESCVENQQCNLTEGGLCKVQRCECQDDYRITDNLSRCVRAVGLNGRCLTDSECYLQAHAHQTQRTTCVNSTCICNSGFIPSPDNTRCNDGRVKGVAWRGFTTDQRILPHQRVEMDHGKRSWRKLPDRLSYRRQPRRHTVADGSQLVMSRGRNPMLVSDQPNLTRSDSTTIHTGDARHHNINTRLNRASYLIAGRVVAPPSPTSPPKWTTVTTSLRASFCRIADQKCQRNVEPRVGGKVHDSMDAMIGVRVSKLETNLLGFLLLFSEDAILKVSIYKEPSVAFVVVRPFRPQRCPLCLAALLACGLSITPKSVELNATSALANYNTEAVGLAFATSPVPPPNIASGVPEASVYSSALADLFSK